MVFKAEQELRGVGGEMPEGAKYAQRTESWEIQAINAIVRNTLWLEAWF